MFLAQLQLLTCDQIHRRRSSLAFERRRNQANMMNDKHTHLYFTINGSRYF